jgi:hypothetical protein
MSGIWIERLIERLLTLRSSWLPAHRLPQARRLRCRDGYLEAGSAFFTPVLLCTGGMRARQLSRFVLYLLDSIMYTNVLYIVTCFECNDKRHVVLIATMIQQSTPTFIAHMLSIYVQRADSLLRSTWDNRRGRHAMQCACYERPNAGDNYSSNRPVHRKSWTDRNNKTCLARSLQERW